MNTLPTGWAKTPIDTIAAFNPKTIADDALKCAFSPMQHLGTRFRAPMSYENRLWGEIKKAYVHFRPRDVIVAKVTPCFENGKAGIVPSIPNGIGAGSSEFCVFRPAKGIDERYLLAWLSTQDFRRRATVAMTGSVGLKRVPKDVFLSEEIPLAPELEQRRIAHKLDTILTRVDALNGRLARITPLLKRFRQSVLAAATSGRLTEDWRIKVVDSTGAAALLKELTNDHIAEGGHERGNASEPTKEAHDLSSDQLPSGWQVGNLRDCCTPGRPITYGILKPGPELEIGVPYIRVADFPGNRLNPEKIKKTSPEIDMQYKRARLASGDLLLSIRGSVGRLIEIPADLEGANITQDTARLSISQRLSSRYIYFAILAPDTQRRMANAIRGVAVRGINIGDVRALQVPIPTKEEQTEIVRRVEILFAYADRLEARLQTVRTAADRLTPALLAKAFRGELVPQDPNDEPASELLRRLREARAAEAPAKQARGRKAQVA